MNDMVKFASQVNAELLGQVRDMAKTEGRHLQALIEEALADLVEKKRNQRPQPDAMAIYQASHAK